MAITTAEQQALNIAFDKVIRQNGLPNGLSDTLSGVITSIAASGAGTITGDLTINTDNHINFNGSAATKYLGYNSVSDTLKLVGTAMDATAYYVGTSGVIGPSVTGPSILLRGASANTGAAESVAVWSSTSLTAAGAKVMTWYSDGGVTQVGSINKDGSFANIGNITANGAIFGLAGTTNPLYSGIGGAGATLQSFWYAGGNGSVGLWGNKSDAATAVGVISDNQITLTTAGAKIHSFRNNGTELASVDYTGKVTANGGFTSAAGSVNVGGDVVTSVGGDVASGRYLYTSDYTDDSATTGNRTVNKVAGMSAFAAASNTITITNSRVQSTHRVFAILMTNDATAVLKNVVVSAGSFTINLTANTTGITKVGWWVIP